MLIGALLLIAVMAIWLIRLSEPEYITKLPPLPRPDSQSNNPGPPRKSQVVHEADSARFVREIAPAATDFVRRVELSGMKLPFTGPIMPQRLTMLNFGKAIHIFVVDGHSVFHFHDFYSGERRHTGIHVFNHAGTDVNGTPWNVDTILIRPQNYADALIDLADTTRFPQLDIGTLQGTARGLVHDMRPGVSYDAGSGWQYAFGATKLPFYNFVFQRSGQKPTTSVTVKSTVGGLELQHYEDLGFAF